MSTQNTSGATARILWVLAVGLLLVAAWVGGRWSAGGDLPFGMMDGRMHGGAMHNDNMRGGGMMGDGRMSGGRGSESGDFEGEMGLRRCRAMMGTMSGMHRSMRSMMGGGADQMHADSAGRRSDRGMMGGHMRQGMMGMHGSGRRGMAQQEEMSPEEMRQLCRTMHESMQTAMHGDPGGASSAGADSAMAGEDLEDETRQWLQGTRGFEQIDDRRGEDEVIVEVGADGGLKYAPAAIRVDPGTTVRWRWTGSGGLHNVAFVNAEVSTSLRDEKGAEFTHTFDASGAYRYECTPHAGVGMRGVVIVSETNY